MRALLIGAGRMGLTHLALFNLITRFGVRWTVVEPSTAVALGLKTALPRNLLEDCRRSIDLCHGMFDFGVITSPTSNHAEAYMKIHGRVAKTFVEKPLAVAAPNSATLCGYVLLHHPLHRAMKDYIAGKALAEIRVTLRANTIVQANTGWRGRLASGGGVINEFGSHTFSLLIDLGGEVQSSNIEAMDIAHSVDAPDRARLVGVMANGTSFVLDLDWTDVTVRKPSYKVSVTLASEEVITNDFYEIQYGNRKESVADRSTDCDVYLRGVEFTNQAKYFLDHDDFVEPLRVAQEVDRVLAVLRDSTRR